MTDAMLIAKTREVATELGASMATNGRWLSEKVEPRCENLEDGIQSEGTEELVEGITTTVVDAN